MSVSVTDNLSAPSLSLPQTPLRVPLRNMLTTLALTTLSLFVAGWFWREQGYEMLIVAMGWPHVLLGFSFFFGRLLRGEKDSLRTFLFLGVVTATICAIHYRYSITGIIYLYFLFHLFRDEIFVYLQTRARHRPGSRVYAVAGVAPLIILILLIPKQEAFRHDLRRVEFFGSQVSMNSWTWIPFQAVPNSSGRDFYFYLQAPQTEGLRAFVTHASTTNARDDGEIIVGKNKWAQAEDLVFQPHYADDPQTFQPGELSTDNHVPVLLTGGHSVGQTFRGEKNNLDGIWIPVNRFEHDGTATRFLFHLASPPLLPYSVTVNRFRLALMLIMGIAVLWRLVPGRGNGWQLWIYLAVFAVAFDGTQMILKSSNNAGYPFPLIFQFAVVFHYWSWYVFSLDKLSVKGSSSAPPAIASGPYDRILSYLGSKPHFTAIAIMLNVISALAVFWFYRVGAAPLKYFLDYNYFLYFLVFHVTFSFRPNLRLSSS